MGSRTLSHQLSNGLYVSGRPDQPNKEKQATMSSRSSVYTGGDVNKSGDLKKMFPPTFSSSNPSTPSTPSGRSGPMKVKKNSSGPIQLQPTGLITSGPLERDGNIKRRSSSENLEKSCSSKKMGLVPGSGGGKKGYGPGVTTLTGKDEGKGRLVLGYYMRKFPDAELRGAVDGQFVKVTGVVTCGSIPLESSYQRVSRCVYVATQLYEYKGWGGKSANPSHRSFSWGSRYSEKRVADFYISDFQSGLRALVKAGYGARVSVFVKPSMVVDTTEDCRELSPNFLRWLTERNLSSDDRIMRLKEGYIKEGSTVSIMGIVRRHDNVLMIIPPAEPISTGCQWLRCFLPTNIEGLVIKCDDNQDADVVPV